jgi:hypothetical protein
MKRLHCFCLLPLLLACLLVTPAPGQNTPVDKDRMERDIDIMEKVLNELFKNAAGNRSRSFYLSSGRTAQGSYVPATGCCSSPRRTRPAPSESKMGTTTCIPPDAPGNRPHRGGRRPGGPGDCIP